MKVPDSLKDVGAERGVIGTIITNGPDALIDIGDLISDEHFSLPLNRDLYKCILSMSEDPSCDNFDTEVIKTKAKSLGLEGSFESEAAIEYLEYLKQHKFSINQARQFAKQVRKLAVARELHKECFNSLNFLESISGSESLSEILAQVEGNITNFVNGVDSDDSLSHIGRNILSHIQKKLDSEPLDSLGISSGFLQWDRAVGGGLRRGTVNVTGSRPKTGKTMHAMNIARNVAIVQNIPVLYLDTEMTLEDQQARLISMDSRCPIIDYEKGSFSKSPKMVKSVLSSAERIENAPFYYKSIAGMDIQEVLMVMRRWIVKHVGFNEEGKANDCVILYDYLKLTSTSKISSSMPEFLVLGLMLTQLHDFAVKYSVPIKAYVQLNRDGVTGEDASVIAGSDRILWLCSNLSILKNKDQADKDMQCGHQFGNKKVLVVETRHGPGLDEDDYINIEAHMRPGVPQSDATGLMREGILFSQRKMGNIDGDETVSEY